jgi:flagellar protein FlbD
MIELTRTNSRKIILNSELIEFIEATPDIIITMTTGTKVLVKDSVEEIIKKIIDYKRKINYFTKAGETDTSM